MELNFERHEGTQEGTPPDVEVTPTCVYLRRNVHREEREDGMGGTEALWVYDEAKASHEDYMLHMIEKHGADIEYLAMMEGIDLD